MNRNRTAITDFDEYSDDDLLDTLKNPNIHEYDKKESRREVIKRPGLIARIMGKKDEE